MDYDNLIFELNKLPVSKVEKKFDFYIPIDLEISASSKCSFSVDSTKFTLYPKSCVTNLRFISDRSMLARHIPSSKLPSDTDRAYIRFTGEGEDLKEARGPGLGIFERLRGAFNFIFSRNTRTYHPSNSTTQNALLFPNWLVYKSDSWDAEFFVVGNMREAMVSRYAIDDFKIAAKFASQLNGGKGSFKSLISDVINLHTEARDIEYEREAFLAYWRVIERMTLADNLGGTTKDVINRIKILFTIRNFKHPPLGLLNYMAKARNLAVHRGEYAYIHNLGDVNRLITILIEMLLSLISKIETEKEMDYIYRNFNLNEMDSKKLSKALKTIKYINSRTQELHLA